MKNIDIEIQKNIFDDSFYQFQKVYQPLPQDSPIIDLIDDFEDGQLDHEPEYQRKFVWDDVKQSYFIESILYGIDTPIIYFVEIEKEIEGYTKIIKEAIDGRQRLSTIFRFYNNDLKIVGLKKNTPLYEHLEGKKFNDLEEKLKDAFKSYSIRTITFKLVDRGIDIDTQLKFKYQLFYRYNSGLTSLNQQELRNCIYHKNDFLILFKRISNNTYFKKLCPFFDRDQRMGNVEFASLLYFLTLFDEALSIYSKKWKNYLINKTYEDIEKGIYNLEIFDNNPNITLTEEKDEIAEDIVIDEKQVKKEFFKQTEISIIENLHKVYQIYGEHLKGAREERYIIETIYYSVFFNENLTKEYLDTHAVELGIYINQQIENQKKEIESEFNLIDCYRERVSDTLRVIHRFDKMKEFISEYIKNN